jgi:DNA replication licensing factor MCM3
LQYDVHKDPHKNIALPDSLLSRFDLLFVVTDDVDEQRDRMISEHVLRMHRYLQPGLDEGQPAADSLDQALNVGAPDGTDADGAAMLGDSSPFEKYNPLLHAGVTASGSAKKREVLSMAFVKKYIQYAKQRIQPALSKGAAEWIVNVYANLRNDEMSGNQRKTSPLTARTLETLIRLSTAHAKARLSSTVDERDAEAAEEILRFALFKEVITSRRQNKRQRTANGSRSPEGDSDLDDDADVPEVEAAPYKGTGAYSTRGATRNGAAAKDVSPVASLDDDAMDEDAEAAMEEADAEAVLRVGVPPAEAAAAPVAAASISEARLGSFRDRMAAVMSSGGSMAEEEAFSLDALLPAVNHGLPSNDLFSSAEARAALQQMSDADQIMLDAEGVIYRI